MVSQIYFFKKSPLSPLRRVLNYEPTQSLFASHLPIVVENDGDELSALLPPEPASSDPCQVCQQDKGCRTKRHSDWALWRREVEEHGTR